jgi:hypothetical protein
VHGLDNGMGERTFGWQHPDYMVVIVHNRSRVDARPACSSAPSSREAARRTPSSIRAIMSPWSRFQPTPHFSPSSASPPSCSGGATALPISPTPYLIPKSQGTPVPSPPTSDPPRRHQPTRVPPPTTRIRCATHLRNDAIENRTDNTSRLGIWRSSQESEARQQCLWRLGGS